MRSELSEAFDAALHTSKRVRTETDIQDAGISLVHTGLDLASSHLDGLAGRSGVVIGAGVIGNLAGKLLKEAGVADLTVVSRSPDKAERLVQALGCRVVGMEELGERLTSVDVVVSSTSATDLILNASFVRSARELHRPGPLSIVDLAIPRDVDPDCGLIEGVKIFDVHAIGATLVNRQAPLDVDRARRIVAEEVALFLTRDRSRVVAPLITALHRRVGGYVENELNRFNRQNPSLDAVAQRAVSKAVHRLAGRFLHEPTERAKELAGSHDELVAFSRVFDLQLEETGA